MASAAIRIGVIGANIHRGWAPQSHLPALAASPDFELVAVCTTRRETAEESAKVFGARLAFDDYREMLAHPEIDAVAVVLRVPWHYQPTLAAIDAGKHIYTEWPLGRTLAEAEEMAQRAEEKKVCHIVGLQARRHPTIMHMKALVESGYVGEVMSCHVSMIRAGILQRPSDRAWQCDDALGASPLTIPFGHTVDAMQYVIGPFSQVSSVVSTQAKQWLETDTQEVVEVTAPDTVLVSGHLANGGVASVHVATIPWAGSGYRMEVYGREGTLVAYGENSPQLSAVYLQGAKAGDGALQEIAIPSEHIQVPDDMPAGAPYNVGQMYAAFGKAIRAGEKCQPDFSTAVSLHRFIDTVRASSQQSNALAVPTI
ncbi:MAG: putative dehydrogenase [Candidatus Latescibacterota bacterium]|jgi:predicted dehydrogenase